MKDISVDQAAHPFMCHFCCDQIQYRKNRYIKRKMDKAAGHEDNQEEAKATKIIEDCKADQFCPHSEDITIICDFCQMAYKHYGSLSMEYCLLTEISY